MKLVGIVILLLLIALSPLGRAAVGAFKPVEAVTASQAAATVSTYDGRPALIMLYGPRCPLSQRLFPRFVALSNRVSPAGAEVLAYGTGDGIDAGLIGCLLMEHHARFAARRISHWQPGELTTAFGGAGIEIGSQWVQPLVAVRSGSGRIVYQEQGVQDLGSAIAALDAELAH